MEDITEEVPEVIQEIVQKIIEKENFYKFNEATTKITTDDNNFLGELYEVEINGETEDGHKKMHIFVKRMIKNDNFKLCSLTEVYKKEAFVYLELSKIFERVQDDANVPEGDRFNMAKSYEETNSECIVLDNLAAEGYKTIPRGEVMSVEYAQEGISQLAKFHALSFVIEAKHPEYFETNLKTLKASVTYDDYWHRFAKKVSDIAISQFDDELKRRLVKFLEMSSEKYPKYMNGVTSTFKCLCHGDYKMNNILHKVKEGRIHLIPIDYQHVYHGCPLMDFMFFIYAASDAGFRQNLNDLKQLYYETLTSFLKYFDIAFEVICSRREFDKCFEESREYALMFSLYLLPLFYVVGEKPSAKDDLMELALNVDGKFHERMKEIVDEFVHLNII